MATADVSAERGPTCEQIRPEDIRKLSVIGRGSFGKVFKGTWRGIYVAMKQLAQGSDDKDNALHDEIRQLSRAKHENIVKLYGACIDKKILVMEYADGGSLCKLLHSSKCDYTLAHAMSWVHQCAKGVEYLHLMKPTPLLHRDLKPENLLLFNECLHLKICDFGTVTEQRTKMTIVKGSARWMAPEVFTSSTYVEKCDIYSWSIIFWQVLSRRIPFDTKDANICSIMWSVYRGHRPPKLENCPGVIEKLITRCWSSAPENRPTMSQIVQVMDVLTKHIVPKNLKPIFANNDECTREEVGLFQNANTRVSSVGNPPQLVLPHKSMFKALEVAIDENRWENIDEGIITTTPGFDVAENGSSSTVQTGMQSTSSTTQNTSAVDTNLDPDIEMQVVDPHQRPPTPNNIVTRFVGVGKRCWHLRKDLCKLQKRMKEFGKKQPLLQQTTKQQVRRVTEQLVRGKHTWSKLKKHLEEIKLLYSRVSF